MIVLTIFVMLLALAAFVNGAYILSISETSIHQILSYMSFLISAVLFSCGVLAIGLADHAKYMKKILSESEQK